MAKRCRRPNFLWITLEDCSPRLGCYGDSIARTPNLDRLAAEGCRFEHAFSTAPVCAPSRCAVITGMYANAIGAQHMRTGHVQEGLLRPVPPYEAVPPPHVRLIPEYLRHAGYYCTNNSKTDYQFASPFTAWDENGESGHWRNRRNGQPFFAVFNFTRTHESGMWPESRETITTDPDTVQVPPYLADTPATRQAIARHYDNLEEVDRQAGELLEQLEADGELENTYVFVWSDHGEGLPRAKRWPYDSGTRVPLIVRHPEKARAGEVRWDVVSLIDLGPTVLSLAGVSLPEHLQGVPFLGERNREPRTFAFSTRDRFDIYYDRVRSVRDARYRYVRNDYPELTRALWNAYQSRHPANAELWRLFRENSLTPDQQFLFAPNREVDELYDLVRDPHETHNLAHDSEFADVLQHLKGALKEWEHEIGDLGYESEEALRTRLWPDGEQPETFTPVFVPYDVDHCGREPAGEPEIALKTPAALQLFAPNQGASSGYRFADDPPDAWRLYTGPFRLEPGEHHIQAKSIRIGYRESTPASIRVTVEDE